MKSDNPAVTMIVHGFDSTGHEVLMRSDEFLALVEGKET